MKELKKAIENRRTYYNISNKSTISDDQIKEIIDFAVLHVPSAFNSQSARIVLLLGNHHKKLWNIVKDVLKKLLPADIYPATKDKIDGAFATGYGTVLFYEDQSVIKGLQNAFASYRENFPVWSQHTSAMHQFAIWTMLEEAGLGASLQHYNPIIDEAVAREWGINSKWKLIAQMPFGTPTEKPASKEFQPLKGRVSVFK
jgi:predicted oxidoreductase (fatty acid repression mutant protein)